MSRISLLTKFPAANYYYERNVIVNGSEWDENVCHPFSFSMPGNLGFKCICNWTLKEIKIEFDDRNGKLS